MNKLLTTIEALESALSDAPETPTAWVPLRRATVEAAYRVLGSIPVAISILGALDETGEVPPTDDNVVVAAAAPAPTWRYPVLSAEEAASQGERVLPGNGNGAVTVAPAELVTYTQPAASDGKAPNMWRRLPKPERLALACAEIARIAAGRSWVTQAEFDHGKPDSMPSASGLVATLDLTWIELVCKALPAAVVPAAQPGKRKAKEPAASAAEPFRGAAAQA